MPRLQRLTDFIARLLGKEWDVRALDRRRSSGPVDSQGRSDEPPTISPYVRGHVEPSASGESADSTTPAGSSGHRGLGEPIGSSIGSGQGSRLDRDLRRLAHLVESIRPTG